MSKELLAAKQAAVQERIIRLKELCRITGMSRTTVWRRAKDDNSFPPSFRISQNIVGWKLSDVNAWMDSLSLNGGY